MTREKTLATLGPMLLERSEKKHPGIFSALLEEDRGANGDSLPYYPRTVLMYGAIISNASAAEIRSDGLNLIRPRMTGSRACKAGS